MRRRIEEVLKTRQLPYRTDVPTASLSTFRIGGSASVVLEPRCTGELIESVLICARQGLPYAVIGRGSNILFGDGEIETVLIRTAALDAVRSFSDGRIFALCGVSLARLTAFAAREGLEGLTFACGIPGTLGGAIFMNAGAHGKEISDVVESVQVLLPESGETRTLFNHELSFSYRNSCFQDKNMVVISATLRLALCGDPAKIFKKMRELNAARREKQPLELPSAGSAFRRPSPEIAVARIVDELGLKGKRVGGAQVSEKHAGFIVNQGGATARDVRALIEEIQNTVERERGFRPTPEIRFIPEE